MLIVMGTRGKSQKELDLIGSVTAEVLDSTKLPVFAVPESVPFIRDEKIDILTMTTRKRNIFARLFNPSIAHKMLFHADTPLLVIPSVGW